jgi:hypothetical protein
LQPGSKLRYKIPFPVGMDKLFAFGTLSHEKIMDFIEVHIPHFRSYSEKDRESQQYLKQKQFSAKTFEEYGLRGTPSAIVIDKNGILRQTLFGSNGFLENAVKQLINE